MESQRSLTRVSSRTLRRGWFWARPSAGMAGSVGAPPPALKRIRTPRSLRRACTSRGGASHLAPMDAQYTSAVTVDRLVKRYKAVAAVDGISFRLIPGTITGLLGGNGAGKTTTIAMIMGLVTPTSGTVSVLGAQMPQERYRVLHRMNFESPYVALPMRLTVRQNLSVFAQLYAVADIDEQIAGLAADLDLIDILDRQTGK